MTATQTSFSAILLLHFCRLLGLKRTLLLMWLQRADADKCLLLPSPLLLLLLLLLQYLPLPCKLHAVLLRKAHWLLLLLPLRLISYPLAPRSTASADQASLCPTSPCPPCHDYLFCAAEFTASARTRSRQGTFKSFSVNLRRWLTASRTLWSSSNNRSSSSRSPCSSSSSVLDLDLNRTFL